MQLQGNDNEALAVGSAPLTGLASDIFSYRCKAHCEARKLLFAAVRPRSLQELLTGQPTQMKGLRVLEDVVLRSSVF